MRNEHPRYPATTTILTHTKQHKHLNTKKKKERKKINN